MPEVLLLVWKDAEGGEITLVNAAAFAADLLEMSKRSVYHFDGGDDSERRLGEYFALLSDEIFGKVLVSGLS